jgi:hypothetical protein
MREHALLRLECGSSGSEIGGHDCKNFCTRLLRI